MSEKPKLRLSGFWMLLSHGEETTPPEEIDAAYAAEIAEYLEHPVPPCTKAQSLKLLKRFHSKPFPTFWNAPIQEYLPAVSEGSMKLEEKFYTHDEAMRRGKELIADLDPKALARAFLYGLAHNAPEYRTALACYYFFKSLPEHEFEKRYIGSSGGREIYSKYDCNICYYRSKPQDEPKMRFWSINITMYHFYFQACMPFFLDPNQALVFLEEYKTLPVPPSSSGDLAFFNQVISVIEAQPENTSPSKLRKALKQSGLLSMNTQQINAFIDMLGYLNILHPDDSFGITVHFIRKRDIREPKNPRTYFAYPVNLWTGKDGIDYEMIDTLFGDLY